MKNLLRSQQIRINHMFAIKSGYNQN